MRAGVEFDTIDVFHDPAGLAELAALGVKTTPVVARGSEYVLGQVTADVARFLGLGFERDVVLTAAQLAARLETVLETAQRLFAQLPEEALADNLPLRNRRRSYLELCHHIVRIQEAFLEAMDGVEFTAEQPVRPPPAGLRTRADLIAYAAAVRARVRAWWARQSATDPACRQMLPTYFGEQSCAVLLERTAWHCAQHTRQLAWLLKHRLGIAPDRPLTAQDLRGLPLPELEWEEETA